MPVPPLRRAHDRDHRGPQAGLRGRDPRGPVRRGRPRVGDRRGQPGPDLRHPRRRLQRRHPRHDPHLGGLPPHRRHRGAGPVRHRGHRQRPEDQLGLDAAVGPGQDHRRRPRAAARPRLQHQISLRSDQPDQPSHQRAATVATRWPPAAVRHDAPWCPPSVRMYGTAFSSVTESRRRVTTLRISISPSVRGTGLAASAALLVAGIGPVAAAHAASYGTPVISLSAAYLSGAVGASGDPTVTATVSQSGADASALTVAASASSKTSVAATGDVAVSGTGGARTVAVSAHAQGYTDLTLKVTGLGGKTATKTLHYAASPAVQYAADSRYLTGASDASAAVDVGDGYMVVANDE